MMENRMHRGNKVEITVNLSDHRFRAGEIGTITGFKVSHPKHHICVNGWCEWLGDDEFESHIPLDENGDEIPTEPVFEVGDWITSPLSPVERVTERIYQDGRWKYLKSGGGYGWEIDLQRAKEHYCPQCGWGFDGESYDQGIGYENNK